MGFFKKIIFKENNSKSEKEECALKKYSIKELNALNILTSDSVSGKNQNLYIRSIGTKEDVINHCVKRQENTVNNEPIYINKIIGDKNKKNEIYAIFAEATSGLDAWIKVDSSKVKDEEYKGATFYIVPKLVKKGNKESMKKFLDYYKRGRFEETRKFDIEGDSSINYDIFTKEKGAALHMLKKKFGIEEVSVYSLYESLKGNIYQLNMPNTYIDGDSFWKIGAMLEDVINVDLTDEKQEKQYKADIKNIVRGPEKDKSPLYVFNDGISEGSEKVQSSKDIDRKINCEGEKGKKEMIKLKHQAKLGYEVTEITATNLDICSMQTEFIRASESIINKNQVKAEFHMGLNTTELDEIN